MSTTATSLSQAEFTDQVLQILERARKPLTVFQIQRSLPRSLQDRTDELRQCLQEQLSKGRLHEFAPYRSKAPRFWTRDSEQHARAVIIEVLDEQARTQRELLGKVHRRLQGLPEGRLRQLLVQMLLDGEVRKLPPRVGGRSHLLSIREPQPRDYLAPVFKALVDKLHEVFKRLESEGVSRETFQRQADELGQAMPWDTLSEELSSPQAVAPPIETPAPPFAPSTPVESGLPDQKQQPSSHGDQTTTTPTES